MHEDHFKSFRKNIVGIDASFQSPYGEKKIVYFDWIASGRLYRPIEDAIVKRFGPFVANTHTETTQTGTIMTKSYHLAHALVKKHVNAGSNDVIITAGSGMTTVVNKLQRILGLKGCGSYFNKQNCMKDGDRPVIFVTHMEHHSNHTSWYETVADIVVLQPDKNLLVDPGELEKQLELYKDRKFKIGSFTACSNVTGIKTPYHQLSKIMHQYGGICFVDFAASAPYSDINMHPDDPLEKLDGIFFSPHKFLGGPGTSGVLVFDSSLYHSEVPDNPGGGTVDWTNPWGRYKYVDDIELREDGGTPGFLQAMKTALALDLKNKMKTLKIHEREEVLVKQGMQGLRAIPGIKILADKMEDRLAIISFYHPLIHFNLLVKLLNDLFGIQVRGGCACAGTYGHFLLEVSYEKSKEITDRISSGDLSQKPGWVRWSIHPTTTIDEVNFFIDGLKYIVKHIDQLEKDYKYISRQNEFYHKSGEFTNFDYLEKWFDIHENVTIKKH